MLKLGEANRPWPMFTPLALPVAGLHTTVERSRRGMTRDMDGAEAEAAPPAPVGGAGMAAPPGSSAEMLTVRESIGRLGSRSGTRAARGATANMELWLAALAVVPPLAATATFMAEERKEER